MSLITPVTVGGEVIVIDKLANHLWQDPQSRRSYPRLVVTMHNHKEMNISKNIIFHL